MEDSIKFDDMNMDEAEEDSIAKEDDFSKAVLWATDWTIETIASQIAKGNIDLNPNFQRRDAWSLKDKSKLIESLMLGIPVPQIILAEDKANRNHYFVLDGKQRLLSIMQFYADSDVINSGSVMQFDKLTLTGLEILNSLNKKTYSNISKGYLANIDNGTIRTVIIKNWPTDDLLYAVFLRLNTGSMKLSPQELRQALKPGLFLNFLDQSSAESKQMLRMLNNSKPDKRMRDAELALRYFAFKFNFLNYKGNLRGFLDETCENLNEHWDDEHDKYENAFKELENAISYAYDLLGEDAFRRFSKGESLKAFNRCIYELFSFFFSCSDVRDCINADKELFIKKFKELNDNDEFNKAIADYPKQTVKVVTRFNLFTQLLESIDKTNLLGKLPKYKCVGIGIEEI